jgi:hypothetical protein
MFNGGARFTMRFLAVAAIATSLIGLAGTSTPTVASPAAHVARAAAPGHWTFSHAHAANGLACPSIHLCVGVELNKLTWTKNPTAAKPRWKRVALEPAANKLEALSCPTVHFCLVGDSIGNTFSSTNPTGGKAAWHKAQAVSLKEAFGAVSCSSPTFCAMLDFLGDGLVSTDPGAATPTWHSTPLDFSTGAQFFGLSCAGKSLCVAVESSSVIMYTTNPTASTGAVWHMAKAGNHDWDDVNCPTARKCVVAGTAEQNSTVAVTSNPAAGSKSWKTSAINDRANGGLSRIDCVNGSFCFAIADEYTTHLAAKKSAWHAAALTIHGEQAQVSCVSTTRCFFSTEIGGFLSWKR